ncbi:MAG TPA: cation diffusion facilitator family transporter [Acidimicrobiales bacterium]|nr:cation diffusion facilitator family transporter [Acidimicrobiales bacterium]
MAHDDHVARDADETYLFIALILIGGYMVGEVIFGVLARSLALLADAGHMLTDAGALGASIWAIRLARRPAEGAWTYGFKRAEILSAAVNGVALLVVAALVTFEAVARLLHTTKVDGLTLTVVAASGVIVNLAATLTLARANRRKLNIAGAFAHVATDLIAFIGTMVAGIVILATHFQRADAIASLVVVVLMLFAARSLLANSGRILLEAAPEGVDLEDIREHLLSAPHVTEVHDLHAWVVTSDLPALSAHVVVEESCFVDGHAPQILDRLQACLVGHFDVEHSTFQLEPPGHTEHEQGSH